MTIGAQKLARRVAETPWRQIRMDKNQYKECPFCGGTDIHLGTCSGTSAEGMRYFGSCHTCWASSTYKQVYSKADAIKTWNTRADSQGKVEAIGMVEAGKLLLQAMMVEQCGYFEMPGIKATRTAVVDVSKGEKG
jgi:Lar family restriction alleviation protein